MWERMKTHRTSDVAKIIIEMPRNGKKTTLYISLNEVREVETFLHKHSATVEISEPEDWKILAKDRIEKYKKAGIVLRGARYRENLSQKELAKKSKVRQEDISKIENGKRTVGERVAKRLARVLNINYNLFLDIPTDD